MKSHQWQTIFIRLLTKLACVCLTRKANRRTLMTKTIIKFLNSCFLTAALQIPTPRHTRIQKIKAYWAAGLTSKKGCFLTEENFQAFRSYCALPAWVKKRKQPGGVSCNFHKCFTYLKGSQMIWISLDRSFNGFWHASLRRFAVSTILFCCSTLKVRGVRYL